MNNNCSRECELKIDNYANFRGETLGKAQRWKKMVATEWVIKLEDLNFIAISLSLNIVAAFPFVCHQPNTLFWTFPLILFFSVFSTRVKSTLTLLILWYLHFHRSLPLTRTWIINLKWVELNGNCSLFSLLSRQCDGERTIKGSNNNDTKISTIKRTQWSFCPSLTGIIEP